MFFWMLRGRITLELFWAVLYTTVVHSYVLTHVTGYYLQVDLDLDLFLCYF